MTNKIVKSNHSVTVSVSTVKCFTGAVDKSALIGQLNGEQLPYRRRDPSTI